MAFKSAAGRHIPDIAHTGEVRPLVTEDENVLIELVLSENTDRIWADHFESIFSGEKVQSVTWAHVRESADGHPTVTFRLESTQDLLAAVDSIRGLIARTSQAWREDPTVADQIARQHRIDHLDEQLRRTIGAYSL